jgi:peptidoglycan/LPS O-acetylase OafA/YrhL
MRHLAGVALLVLAAVLVHRSGHTDQQWQYAAIAAALMPQVLLDGIAVGDRERRARLRVSQRPALLPLLAAGLLAVTTMMGLASGQPDVAVLAALSATVGLAVVAAPVTVTFRRRRKRSTRPPRESATE